MRDNEQDDQPQKKKDGSTPGSSEPGSTSKVRDWLTKTGYPTELRAERICKQAGLDTRIGDFYLDSETGKYRESDVVASLSRTFRAQMQPGPRVLTESIQAKLQLVLVGECKTSMKQFVVFSAEAEDLVAPELDRIASPAGRTLLATLYGDSATMAMDLFATPERIGYAVAQSGSTEDGEKDPAFRAIVQVLDGALARRIGPFDVEKGVRTARLVFPAIILGGELFECHLDAKGDLQIEKRDAMRLYWRKPLNDTELTIVDIVTLDGLPALCEHLRRLFARIEGVHLARLMDICQTVEE